MSAARAGALTRVAPLYLVVFIGFVGYSLMITIFTPLILRADGGVLPSSTPLGTRTLVLGGLLAVYPLAQFVGSPILGALSDRFGRRPVLLASLAASTAFYGLLALALHLRSLPLLVLACLLAGLSEANIAIAQSAIADVSEVADRGRLFGYVYLCSSLASPSASESRSRSAWRWSSSPAPKGHCGQRSSPARSPSPSACPRWRR